MIDRRLREIWHDLQAKKPHMPQFLSEIQLKGLRGIHDLRVTFEYPVSVIAGGNGSGKSTVLFAAACAYKVPGAGIREFVPSTLFPDYRPKFGPYKDERPQTELAFDYATPQGKLAMQWRRRKSGWNRSFLGRRGARQPTRPVYLRTLGNLSNPSEVRSVLRMSHMKAAPEESPLTPLQVDFAQSVLPSFRYSKVVALSSGGGKTAGRRNLLFAAQTDGAVYSELHMAAGERALLRLSQEIAHLQDALVLIDEIEAGLHPWAQELLMLNLQDLALRKDLQIIVTTHSPVVLDSVHPQGRIFLERDNAGRVTMSAPYRDIVQTALYGRSGETLRLLCEDDAAEGVVRGVVDGLAPQLGLKGESVQVGRDTGAEEFPGHVSAFAKFGMVRSFVFVLDGDKRESDVESRIKARAGVDVPVLFLPGEDAPEVWIWECLRTADREIASALGLAEADLGGRTSRLDSIYRIASGRQSEIAKRKIRGLSEDIDRTSSEICRIVARIESGRAESAIQPLAIALERILVRWRRVEGAG